MNRKLLDALRTATGTSCQVAAVFLDVRGFTTFAGVAESTDTAVFLRSFYTRTLERYFNDAAFFKPTGDGLLVIISMPSEPIALRRKINEVLLSCVAAVEGFPALCDDDVMVNFPVPADLGVGLARGSATRIGTTRQTIDYSGRCLNLAARLMDLARPRGVVFHDKFGYDLLEPEILPRFDQEQVYLKGIAEKESLTVLKTKEWTTIPEPYTRPLSPGRRVYDLKKEYSLKELAQYGSPFRFTLQQDPRSQEGILLRVEYPAIDRQGRKATNRFRTHEFLAAYYEDGDGKYGAVNMKEVVRHLTAEGVKSTWKVFLQMTYIG